MKLTIPLPLVDRTTGLKRTAVRFPDGSPPDPDGCRWCGISPRRHDLEWSRAAQWHRWTHPTAVQIYARMTARRRDTR